MIRFARGRQFDCALAHGSTELPAACRVLRIPNTTMFDYEWAALQHHWNCRLASRVLVPDAIPAARLARYGARPPKLVRYPGLKEEYYLSGFEPDRRVLEQLGLDGAKPLAVVRTAPSYALYLGGESPHVAFVLAALADQGAQIVVLARNDEQRAAIRGIGKDLEARLVVPDRAVDGRSLVAFADLLVSAGGTMNREAAVLGTPVWSVFEGRPGAIDELLVKQGRLRVLRNLGALGELEVRKKDARQSPATFRDPRDLLRLALPWVSGESPLR